MNRKALAELIKRAREAKDLTQDQLATKIKISSQQISRWETCRALPDRRTLPRLADALDLDLAELYDLLLAAKDEDIASVQRELSDTRRDFEYASGQMTLFVSTYAEFHAEYQRIGTEVDRLAEKIDRIEATLDTIMRAVVSEPPAPRRERP